MLSPDALTDYTHAAPSSLDVTAELGMGISIQCRDNRTLEAWLYGESTPAPLDVVIVAGGVGIPAKRYRHFAAWLAANGIPSLLLNYRGIGTCQNEDNVAVVIEDWSELDTVAAIDWMAHRYPNALVTGITHSIGGVVMASCPAAHKLHQMASVSPHTGHPADYGKNRVAMSLFWHLVMPTLVRIFGYFPGRLLGLGENVPRGVALQWSKRASDSAGFGERRLQLLARLRHLKVPIVIVPVAGDGFSTPEGIGRFLSLLGSASVRVLNQAGDAGNTTSVGHLAFFSPSAEKMNWPRLFNELWGRERRPL